jgi:hypothetical protein
MCVGIFQQHTASAQQPHIDHGSYHPELRGTCRLPALSFIELFLRKYHHTYVMQSGTCIANAGVQQTYGAPGFEVGRGKLASGLDSLTPINSTGNNVPKTSSALRVDTESSRPVSATNGAELV